MLRRRAREALSLLAVAQGLIDFFPVNLLDVCHVLGGSLVLFSAGNYVSKGKGGHRGRPTDTHPKTLRISALAGASPPFIIENGQVAVYGSDPRTTLI